MKRLLIADDNPLIREVMDRMFTSICPHLDILHAQDGQEAVIAALTEPPDLILLDGHMPLLNGAQVAGILRQMPMTRDIPLIALTGESTNGRLAERLRALCDLYLSKPVSLDDLLAAIDAYLSPEAPVVTTAGNHR